MLESESQSKIKSELSAIRNLAARIDSEHGIILERQNLSLEERNNIWDEIRDIRDSVDNLYNLFEEAMRYRKARLEAMEQSCPKLKEVLLVVDSDFGSDFGSARN